MVMFDYMCLYGLKVKDFLECNGFVVDDWYFKSCEDVDVFKV